MLAARVLVLALLPVPPGDHTKPLGKVCGTAWGGGAGVWV